MSSDQPFRAADAPPSGTGTPDARRLRAVLTAVSIALMAVVASVSGLNVAQTHMAVEWGASQTTVLWIVNVYTLTLAALLLPLGAVGDRLGRKPVLIAGLVLFGAAGVVAAFAPSAAVMIGARVAAGAGAAMIMPITLAVITSTFPEEERGKAIGVWTGVAGGGGILGMFLSALLVDVADWRWLFALPVALAAVALVTTVTSVPDSRERPASSFDTGGALLSAVAVVGLIFVLQEGPERGWTAPGRSPASRQDWPRPSPSWPGSCADVTPRCWTYASSASAVWPAAPSPCSSCSGSRPVSPSCCSRSSRPCWAGRACCPRRR